MEEEEAKRENDTKTLEGMNHNLICVQRNLQ